MTVIDEYCEIPYDSAHSEWHCSLACRWYRRPSRRVWANLPLNVLDIRQHYRIYTKAFHFESASWESPREPVIFSEEREEECREFKSEKRKINALFELFFESTTQKATNSIHSIPELETVFEIIFRYVSELLWCAGAPKKKFFVFSFSSSKLQLLFNFSTYFSALAPPSRLLLSFMLT